MASDTILLSKLVVLRILCNSILPGNSFVHAAPVGLCQAGQSMVGARAPTPAPTPQAVHPEDALSVEIMQILLAQNFIFSGYASYPTLEEVRRVPELA